MNSSTVKCLRNAWYVAGWDTEVSRTLFSRKILGDDILMYRKEDGSPVAVSNVCPHRYAPLDQGRLIGDTVQCGYHGLQFDCMGKCVKAGVTAPIPRNAVLKKYPIVEKYGAIWIWMGDKEPELSLIPDFGWLDMPHQWRAVRGMVALKAQYELVADNLLDLTHLPYVHPTGLGSAPKNVEHEVVRNEQEGSVFWCKRSSHAVEPSPDVLYINPTLKQFPCDKTNNTRWNAPGHVAILVDYRKSGTTDDHWTALRIASMHTPTTASGDHTLQFWSVARNMRLDEPDMDAFITKAAILGVHEQDAGMIEGQWRYLGTADLGSLDLVSLPGDITPTRVRRALAQMIAEEQRETHSGSEATRRQASVLS